MVYWLALGLLRFACHFSLRLGASKCAPQLATNNNLSGSGNGDGVVRHRLTSVLTELDSIKAMTRSIAALEWLVNIACEVFN